MTSQPSRCPRRRAFTLVEMLVVIVILSVVIAIIIPAISGARKAAKNTDTRVTLSQVGNAISMFQTDQRRLPGYFSAKDMGDPVNATTAGGWTGCDNIMLDLLGGTTTQPVAAGIITVGPGASPQTQVNVELAAIGATKQTGSGAVVRGYLAVDAKRFVAQSGLNQRFGGNMNSQYPSLVDSFGEPVLAWVQDEAPSSAAFSGIDTGTPARFYWASNAGFLDQSVTSFGKQGKDQSYSSVGLSGSILAGGIPAANRIRTLDALLGNPASPDESNPPRPQLARGPIVLHSAGADGIHLSYQERGGKAGVVQYTPNQDPFGGGPFDDVIYAAGH